jgi:hypothetical protein
MAAPSASGCGWRESAVTDLGQSSVPKYCTPVWTSHVMCAACVRSLVCPSSAALTAATRRPRQTASQTSSSEVSTPTSRDLPRVERTTHAFHLRVSVLFSLFKWRAISRRSRRLSFLVMRSHTEAAKTQFFWWTSSTSSTWAQIRIRATK